MPPVGLRGGKTPTGSQLQLGERWEGLDLRPAAHSTQAGTHTCGKSRKTRLNNSRRLYYQSPFGPTLPSTGRCRNGLSVRLCPLLDALGTGALLQPIGVTPEGPGVAARH